MSRRSEGAFDITVGPLVDLWQQAKVTRKTPTPEEIATARSKSAYGETHSGCGQGIRSVFAVEGMRIDLGGLPKVTEWTCS